MTRKFKIQDILAQNSGNAVIDIPHTALLRYLDPKNIKGWFKEKWGNEPTGVVLPVALPDGLLFPVKGLDEPISPYARISDNYAEFQDVVRAFSQQGLEIYLLLNPTLEFVRAQPLHIVDIVGDGSHALCIGNPISRVIASAILGTGIDIVRTVTKNTPGKLAGVILDVVNLFPMGATNERLELTCFCPSCEEWFDQYSPGLLKSFRTFPNPWNLMLKNTGSGISFVDDIRRDNSPDDILGLSKQKGFDEIFDEQEERAYLLEQARLLLKYVRARHDQVLASVNDIFSEALHELDVTPRRILLLEGAYYGWTAGLQLESLDINLSAENNLLVPYDEIWFDPAATDVFLKNVPFRSYMWTRSRYFIDEFLRAVDSVSDPVKRASTGAARLSRNEAQEVLRRRLHQCVGAALTGSSTLISLPSLKSEQSQSQRIGFVSVALTKELGEKFIEGINIPLGLEAESSNTPNMSDILALLRAAQQSEGESSKSKKTG